MPPKESRRSNSEKSIQHQYAALTRWSRESGKAQGQKMQAGLLDKFRREVVEADPTVVEPELTRRAECARRAHMLRLAHLSAKARAKDEKGEHLVRTPGGDQERETAIRARFAEAEDQVAS